MRGRIAVEQRLEGVAVAGLGPPGQVVDVVGLHAVSSSESPGKDNAWVSLPTRIGRYAVRRRIGSGGFATVWLGYDEQLDSPVAIKVLADNWTDDHHVKQRFVDEGRFLRKVESPHVVPVYDAGELDDGRPYLVMAFADQGTLADRLDAGGLPRDEALEVVRQVGLGLTALHEQGVLHRDIKPANVLFRTVEGPSMPGPRPSRCAPWSATSASARPSTCPRG